MIKFSLQCDNGHAFDGWFRNNEDYEAQAERKLVACPACGSPDIHIGGKAAVKAPPKPRKRQLALVIALWVIFAGLLASKLVS